MEVHLPSSLQRQASESTSQGKRNTRHLNRSLQNKKQSPQKKKHRRFRSGALEQLRLQNNIYVQVCGYISGQRTPKT